jgi:hypothetical protein
MHARLDVQVFLGLGKLTAGLQDKPTDASNSFRTRTFSSFLTVNTLRLHYQGHAIRDTQEKQSLFTAVITRAINTGASTEAGLGPHVGPRPTFSAFFSIEYPTTVTSFDFIQTETATESLARRYSESLPSRRIRVQTPAEATFCAPVQTGPGTHPCSRTVRTGSPSRGRAAGA